MVISLAADKRVIAGASVYRIIASSAINDIISVITSKRITKVASG